jgi:hypothetical protein
MPPDVHDPKEPDIVDLTFAAAPLAGANSACQSQRHRKPIFAGNPSLPTLTETPIEPDANAKTEPPLPSNSWPLGRSKSILPARRLA